jgi:AbrB family looped-hinge helix DNA binding protein
MGYFLIIGNRKLIVETYMTVTVQIIIPAKVRRKLGMNKGTRVQVEVEENTKSIILNPITRDYIEGL